MRLNREEYFKDYDAITEKREIFKLELPDSYDFDLERKQFEDFKKTGKFIIERYFEAHLADLEKQITNGLEFYRVHVVSLPLSEYMKFELQYYKMNQEHGEQIYMIERSKFDKIRKPKGVENEDLLIINNEVLYLTLYEKRGPNQCGDLIGAEKITDADVVNKYRDYFKNILSWAAPLARFLDEIGES